eukprot:15477858-Alexandrium_andersonii.AAC.1
MRLRVRSRCRALHTFRGSGSGLFPEAGFGGKVRKVQTMTLEILRAKSKVEADPLRRAQRKISRLRAHVRAQERERERSRQRCRRSDASWHWGARA